ncbi:MAG: hypothetical protein DME26_17205 [Verrucomicrobia bacterium]|nr:MAG: hypothetical protein DME26_17205 [Verrucomicrobiota bacterium]
MARLWPTNGVVLAMLTAQMMKIGYSISNKIEEAEFLPFKRYPITGQAREIVVGDLNGDGIPDLATDVNGEGVVSVYVGKGGGTFQPRVNYSVGGSFVTYLALEDFNRDGRLDIVTANLLSSDTVSVLLNKGSVLAQTPPKVYQRTLQGSAGRTNIVEATSDFVTWSSIYTNANPSGTLQFQDSPPAGMSRRFYRARQDQ